MTEHVRWLTYDEVAREMGIARESARQLAIRKRWARQKGNDGRARVGVPEEELQARVTGDDTPHGPSDAPSDDTGRDPSVVQVLTRHISRLEGELKALKQEREAERGRLQGEIGVLRQEWDAERLRAVQVDALTAVVAAEKQRSEEWKAVADRFALQAEALASAQRRSWWPFRRAG
jgi:uncharacterized protein YdbL (DUF1318 family)